MTAEARAVAVSVSAIVYTGPCSYRGVTLQNTHATDAAVVRVYDNTEASGTILATATLDADGGTYLDNVDGGVWAENGLYFSASAGTIEGSVRVG